MGKKQKFSGFVPDNYQEAEAMGRFETERTTSKYSCSPKRKCTSLDVDRSDSFGIPIEVISFAKMSRFEKKELEIRLKGELEQVRNLQKKLQPRLSDIATPSTSYNERTRTENLQRSTGLLSGQGRKWALPGRNGRSMNKGFPRKCESVNRDPLSSQSNLKLMTQCEVLLKKVMDQPYGHIFNTPVDAVKLNIPDYFEVIKHPMDLGTVKSKIGTGDYSSPLEFLADVRLTFSNAMTYNPPGHDVHILARKLSRLFESKWKYIEKKLPVNEPTPIPEQLSVPRKRETSAAKSIQPSKKRMPNSTSRNIKTEKIMTVTEKYNLDRDIKSSDIVSPEHIIDLLQKHSGGASAIGEDDFEINVDYLSDEFMRKKQAVETKAEFCEMEILNVSGFSNSSMQPIEGNDPVEEVDIGESDPPVSKCLVEIDRVTSPSSSKCSATSSSSSRSGSSSSDSDSSSSSGSDSDHVKVSSPLNATKVTPELMGSGDVLSQEINGAPGPRRVNRALPPSSHDPSQPQPSYFIGARNNSRPVSGMDQVEQNAQPKPLSVEVNSRQEGESARSDSQVSQDKLYRAALLRSRFADTILKAREKTMNKSEKGDPEKLRFEKEELERQQREEKARLKAEAEAAEDARRQAELEVAAEAKRRRELQREAARQALLQMEKTVQIENSQFLEDLEMLRAAPAHVHLPPDEPTQYEYESEEGMGCFNFQGASNPLEQLGLFMKMDYVDEEEVVPADVFEPPLPLPPPPPPPSPPIQDNEEEIEID